MVCIGRKLLFALAPAALQSVALAQVPADETVTLHGLTFPPVIAGADRFSLREYEKENPGLGYSVGYRLPDAVATVYIYDLKQREIPDDPAAPAIKAPSRQRAPTSFAHSSRVSISRWKSAASFRWPMLAAARICSAPPSS
jgi:hypothetical protein